MAHLIAVRRRDDYKFTRRQLPLQIDDTFTMVIQLGEKYLDTDMRDDKDLTKKMETFSKRFSVLTRDEVEKALSIDLRHVYSLLEQVTPCVGCRKSVANMYAQLVRSGHQALDPLVIKNTHLTVNSKFVHDAHSIYALFSIHGGKVSHLIDSIPKNKKNKRCNLHSLDNHKSRVSPLWQDTWNIMSLECKDEVLLIDADILLDTLVAYLKKHRFCVECKSKVMHAYNILVGDVDCTKDKTYCQALYEGLRCCPEERHVHIPCNTDFINHLINRAEPELSGSRRERHAKTLDIAQEEVLTCLGLSIYERLYRIGQKLRAEEQTWQLLFYIGVDSIKKSFEVALEMKQGVSNLELMCEELEEDEKARKVRKQVKKQRRKKKREAKRNVVCAVDYDNAVDETEQNCECDTIPSSRKKKETSPPLYAKDHNSNNTSVMESCLSCKGTSLSCNGGKEVHKHTCGRSSDAGYSSDSCENCSNPSPNSSDIACCDCTTHGECSSSSAECSTCLLDECPECHKSATNGAIHHRHCHARHVYVSEHDVRASPTRPDPTCHHTSTTQQYRMTYSLQDMLEEACTSDQEEDVISEEDIRRFKANQKHVTDQRHQLRETLKLRFQNLQLRVCEKCNRNVSAQHSCV